MRGKLKLILIPLYLLILTSQVARCQSVTVIQNLDFGSIYFTGSGGTVTIPTNGGNPTTTGSVGLLSSNPPNRAIFRFTTANRSRTVTSYTYSSSNITISRSGGSGSMTFKLTTPSPSTSYSVGKNTSIDVYIGGTLTIRSSTYNPTGSYSGTFTFRVNYN